MKNKLILASLMLALCFAFGGVSLANAQTTTVNSSASASAAASTSLWRQFVNWLNSLTGNSSGGGQCPIRICGTDPDPK